MANLVLMQKNAVNNTYLILFSFFLLSCQDEMSKKSQGIPYSPDPIVELYRVKLSEYEELKRSALIDGNIKSANRLANHFSYTEHNDDLADYWLAITAKNGSKGAAEIFERRGTTFSEFLKTYSYSSK